MPRTRDVTRWRNETELLEGHKFESRCRQSIFCEISVEDCPLHVMLQIVGYHDLFAADYDLLRFGAHFERQYTSGELVDVKSS